MTGSYTVSSPKMTENEQEECECHWTYSSYSAIIIIIIIINVKDVHMPRGNWLLSLYALVITRKCC